jgi:hypothetical protein
LDALRLIAERKIQEALKEGVLDDLPGRGKPLRLKEEPFVPEELRMAYRVLKGAGYLPPEMELKKEVLSLRELLQSLDDDAERVRRLRELNFKLTKLSMALGRPLHLEDYELRLAQRYLP